jgi:hypothetical protein
MEQKRSLVVAEQQKEQQGEIMKKSVLSALALTGLLALTTGLRADDRSIVANVDHEFVAAGKTFPAGTYSFGADFGSQYLTIRSNDGHGSALVLLMIFDGTAPEQEHLTFQRVAGANYLTEIATPSGVYTLAPPRVSTRVAKEKEHEAMSSAGTN